VILTVKWVNFNKGKSAATCITTIKNDIERKQSYTCNDMSKFTLQH
jgi:hypothetical protein